MITQDAIKTKDADLHIVIRTSNRPNYFRDCMESVRLHAKDAVVTVISDSRADKWYVDKYAPTANYVLLDRTKVEAQARKIPIKRKFFISNYYFNLIVPKLNGWVLLLDDDNEMIHPVGTPEKTNEAYIYSVDVSTAVVPRQDKSIIFKDIDTACIIFHSSQFVEWIPQKGGDYLFVKKMAEKLKLIYRWEVIVRCQDVPHWGKRIDKKA